MNSGSIAFIIICAALVFLMTPALAFFYGGLERRKNVINTMLMAVIPLGLASILWVAIGSSLSFLEMVLGLVISVMLSLMV